MQSAQQELPTLDHEFHALLRGYGQAQSRCTELLAEQARRLAQLEKQVMKLRAEVILRDTALAWEREDRLALQQTGLPRRRTLARRVEELQARVQDLMHGHLRQGLRQPARAETPWPAVATASAATAESPMALSPSPELLEASLQAADLVICQTGCASHDDYWRVEDHCRRTGKTCVLVDRPDALAIVRVQPTADSLKP